MEKHVQGGKVMTEIFKNLTDNPWFWATVALSGLMFINYLINKVKKSIMRTRKLIAAFLVTSTGFVNTAVKGIETFTGKKAQPKKTEKIIKKTVKKKTGK
jgi:hypothetical protein